MALFRAMRVGGTAIFIGQPVVIVVPPPVVVDPPPGGGPGPVTPVARSPFRAHRAGNGAALFLGAAASVVVVTPPPDPPPGTIRQYLDELRAGFTLTFDGGDSQSFDDSLAVVMGFGFAPADALEVEDSLKVTVLWDYRPSVQADISATQETSFKLTYVERARIRGWNSEAELPPRDWIPDPKPNLF